LVTVSNILITNDILANERYMEMAIGNAPWPIGVTNAGIHARPGRERIFRYPNIYPNCCVYGYISADY
jgi:pre-mRNA-splicing factor 18